jgi:hypothetical protein
MITDNVVGQQSFAGLIPLSHLFPRAGSLVLLRRHFNSFFHGLLLYFGRGLESQFSLKRGPGSSPYFSYCKVLCFCKDGEKWEAYDYLSKFE